MAAPPRKDTGRETVSPPHGTEANPEDNNASPFAAVPTAAITARPHISNGCCCCARAPVFSSLSSTMFSALTSSLGREKTQRCRRLRLQFALLPSARPWREAGGRRGPWQDTQVCVLPEPASAGPSPFPPPPTCLQWCRCPQTDAGLPLRLFTIKVGACCPLRWWIFASLPRLRLFWILYLYSEITHSNARDVVLT